MADVKKRIEALRKEIREHDRRYYVLSDPKVSDSEYDALMRDLRALEEANPKLVTPDSPTQRVGGGVSSSFAPVRHRAVMLSLDNTYSKEELGEWLARIKKILGENRSPAFTVEAKIDGVSASLNYRNGVLETGATRGDGEVGEDVTVNLKTIRQIPLKLEDGKPPELIEIRGEVFMERAEFDKFNEKQKKAGEIIFANPRNATSGAIRQKDPRVTGTRPLKFIAHSLGAFQGASFKTHTEFIESLYAYGFAKNPLFKECETDEELWKTISGLEEKMKKLHFEADGLVVRVNQMDFQKALGATDKAPRWAIAYKFAAQQATTVLNAIEYSVGRTGAITPVAHLQPVSCGGVTIKHASLHNFDEIERLGVKVGDRVLIERAGEVIPKVIKVVEHLGKKKPAPPQKCPVCGDKVLKEKEEDVIYRCANGVECPAQLRGILLHWASRDAMEIDGLGEAIVDQLLESKLISNAADLYELKKDQLLTLELFADKKAEKLLAQIEASKKKPLSRVLYGLGIRQVGSKMARILAEHFSTMDALMASGEEKLTQIYEIGPVVAASIREFFEDSHTKKLIQRLKSLGINLKEPKREKMNGPFEGRTVLFTGELAAMPRSEAQKLVESLGGEIADTVTKKVNLLVAGENAGSKLEKAKKQGIEIIDEKEFIKRAR